MVQISSKILQSGKLLNKILLFAILLKDIQYNNVVVAALPA